MPDTLTIRQVDKLASRYYDLNPDSTLYYGQLEISLSKKIGYNPGIAKGMTQVALVNTFRGKYDESAKNYTAALDIYQQLNNFKGLNDSYQGLGRIQDFMGNYDAAIELYKKALAYCLKTPDDADDGECYNVLGVTYDNKGDFSKALDYYFKALLIDLKHNNQASAANKYSNIGVIMQELELYQKAEEYYSRALSYWEKVNDPQGIATVSQDIGDLYIAQRDHRRAIDYLNRAYSIFNRMNDQEGLALIYYDLGLYNYYVHRIDSAVYYLDRSLKSAQKNKIRYIQAYANVGLAKVYNWEKKYQLALSNAKQAKETGGSLKSLIVETDASEQLAAAMAGLKRFEEAYHEHEVFSNLKSRLKHSESIHKAMFYNLELDFAKKQGDLQANQIKKEEVYKQRIASQKNENLIAVGIILVLIVIVLIYYNAKTKQQTINQILEDKNQEIVKQQDDLNELNSLKDRLIGVLAHDLRAPISTLRGLFTLMADENLTGEEFVAMIPKVLNKLENTSDFLDTLLFWINSQVDLKKDKPTNFSFLEVINRELLHLEDKLHQKNISAKKDIPAGTIAFADPSSVRIVIHNFLTNAIKFSNRDSTIELSTLIRNDEVIFCLKDHGVGMTADYLNQLFKSHVTSGTGTENEIGTGMGLLFCKDLIERQKGRIWAKSILGTGTELCFSLPVGKTD